MKKFFTLIAAALCVTTAANAQRLINLEVTMTSPAAGTVITSGGTPFAVKAVVKNVGTVQLKATDSILYQYSWGPYIITFSGGSSLFYRTGKALNQNDTMQINLSSFSITYNTPNNVDSTFDLCLSAIPLNRSADSVRDNVTGNNSGCKSTIRKANPGTAIGTVNGTYGENFVSMYPNPVTTQANFNVEMAGTADVTVQVYDITGRMVINENKGKMSGSNNIPVNTQQLKDGIYLYRVIIGEDVKSGKMVVSQK